jgi:4-amino-4-deoxy-L-arabinose transferase-like glycosyltransferase
VDQPPLIACITWLSAHLFGVSLVPLRLLPAIAGALLVWVTAQIAHELGGGRFAQGVAAFSIIPVPIYLMLKHWLTMNTFEPRLWMTACGWRYAWSPATSRDTGWP